MRPNLYQAARMLTTAGVKADIHFNPTMVTTRLRKSIQKQVESGNITGGWSSHASRIAKVLCTQFKLPYIHGDYWGLHVQFTDVKARAAVVELMRADLSAYVLKDDAHSAYWINSTKSDVNRNIELVSAGTSTRIRLYTGKTYENMVRDVFMKHRTPSDVFNAKQVANMLNQESPIHIQQHNWED